MEPKHHIESSDQSSLTTREQIQTPEEKAFEKYNKALSSADKIIASAEMDSRGVKKLTGINSANAQYMLDMTTWDRNFFNQNTQEASLASIPDNVVEAQRLLFNAYKPTDHIKAYQQEGYKKTCEKISEKDLSDTLSGWGTMDMEKKKDLLRNFGTKLSSSFDFEKEIPLIFMEEGMGGSEATYVEGQGIAIPNSFFKKNKNILVVLELLAHETNHAVQEKLLTSKDSKNIPDVEWFRLAKERSTFISEEEFKRRGKVTDSLESTYHSLPTEKDSFSAQKIFRAELENKITPIMDQKLSDLKLPSYNETKKMLKVFDVLDEFMDISIPITEENLSGRLNEEEKDYLEKSRGSQSFEDYYKSLQSIRVEVLEHFKDIF